MTPFPTIASALDSMRSGELDPRTLTEGAIDRIAALNGRICAYILTTEDLARSCAQTAAQAYAEGAARPLEGIPLAYKDIYETAGIRSTGHSRVLEHHVPAQDASSVKALKAAGGVTLGKLATHEFAFGGPSSDLPWPIARNPWHTDHFTGRLLFRLRSRNRRRYGTWRDRLRHRADRSACPAAFSGIVGLKPSYGLISRRGIMPLSWTLDHAGPMAWTSEDCALMLQAMAGHDAMDPGSAAVQVPDYRAALRTDMNGMKLGVVRHFWEQAGATGETVNAMEEMLRTCERLGAELIEIKLSPLEDYTACCSIILMAEAAAVHEDVLLDQPDLFGANLRMRLSLGAILNAADYIQAMRRRRELCAEVTQAFEKVDALITATTPGPAPRIDELDPLYTFSKPLLTMPFNITGSPALATRIGFSASGLPLSAQIIGKPFADAQVLSIGHAYERATDWASHRPSLCV